MQLICIFPNLERKMYMRINREHKDRLFKFIFEKKENLLQLYNALNDTNVTIQHRTVLHCTVRMKT